MRLLVPPAVWEALERDLLAPGDHAHPFERELARSHRVLPIYGDFMGFWALTREGDIAFLADDLVGVFEPVLDQEPNLRGIHVALAIIARRYPALAPYCPERPANARPCHQCDGSGRISGAPADILCECGGAGWVPAAG
jgi:hypothetical protein